MVKSRTPVTDVVRQILGQPSAKFSNEFLTWLRLNAAQRVSINGVDVTPEIEILYKQLLGNR